MEDNQNENLEIEKEYDIDEPLERFELNGVKHTILGTAHVSKTSAEAVKTLIESADFDAVAIELDQGRFSALNNPDAYAEMDLFKIIRQGKAGAIAVSLALGAFQQRIAEQMGIEPGQEMRQAISSAREANIPILLIDREIGTTLRRVYANVPWWKRITLFSGIIASVFSNEEISEEDIENLKQGDMLESTFSEFAENSQDLFKPLIAERDQFMSAQLRRQTVFNNEARYNNVLSIIGAGHLKGLVNHLKTDTDEPSQVIADLNILPPPSFWPKLIPWIIVAIILAGFVVGFMRSPELGLNIIKDWFLINGVLSAIGAAIAMAHPLTIAASFLAAPFTSLNPTIGAGVVAAAVELWLRKPNVSDFQNLRKDVTSVKGWWKNKVSRTLLVFFLASLGSAIGTFLAGSKIFSQLF